MLAGATMWYSCSRNYFVRRSEMKLEGIHHITAITGDAQANVDFYAGTLGLRMVKKTVNQDAPSVYHLFYADEQGNPGSDITFFEFPGAPPGRAGAGHGPPDRLAGRLAEALDFWAERLAGAGDRDRARRRQPALRRPRGARRTSSSSPTVDDAAADRRPPRGAGRVRAAGLPRRPRLHRRSRAQRRPARHARLRARRTTAGRRAATTAAASGPTTSRRPSAAWRAPARSTTSRGPRDGRAPRAGASGRSPAAPARPR